MSELPIEVLPKCPGCGRPEIHKMCPAWGTSKYMTGELFTQEDEIKYAKEREEAIRNSIINSQGEMP